MKIIEILVQYAKTTSLPKMIAHSLLAMVLVTWGVAAYTTVKHLDTVIAIYDNVTGASDIDIANNLQMAVVINTMLEDHSTLLDVDRLYVSKFHNGKTDLNGIHFLFFSRVAEAAGAGVSRELKNTQNLPLSIFPSMIRELSMRQCYYRETVDGTVSNSQFLITMGVQSMMVCPIWNADQKLIGIIGAEGVRKPINSSDKDALSLSMKPLAKVLGGLLSIQ